VEGQVEDPVEVEDQVEVESRVEDQVRKWDGSAWSQVTPNNPISIKAGF